MALYAVDAQEYVDAVIDAAIRETGIEPAGEIDWRSPIPQRVAPTSRLTSGRSEESPRPNP